MSYQKRFPKILEKTYGNFEDASKGVVPYVKVKKFLSGEKFISLPFLDIVNLGVLEKKDLFLNKRIEIKLSEFNKNLKDTSSFLKENGFKEHVAKGHIITELTSEEDLWKRFHKHTRNDIRKAEKSNLKIEKISSKKSLKKFYKLYSKEMRNFGTPQHSFKFFKNCFEILGKDFFGLNCYRGEKLIASIIIFIDKEYSYVSFNVSDNNFRDFRPNDLLYWETIKSMMKQNTKYLDLGQVDLEFEDNSREKNLLRFKQKWLGKVYKRVYFVRGFEYSARNKKSVKLFRKIWSFLPLPITKFLGPKMISRIGL